MVDKAAISNYYYNKCSIKISHYYTIWPITYNTQWLILMGLHETLKIIDQYRLENISKIREDSRNGK